MALLLVRPPLPDPPKLGTVLLVDTDCDHDFVDGACRFCDAPRAEARLRDMLKAA